MTNLWKPMLATKPDPAEVDTVLAKLPHPALYSPKLDGIRATVQNGKLYSRALKLIPNKAMQALWGREDLDGLDGEIIVGSPTAEDCFNRTTSVVMARDKTAEGAVFNVFDVYDDHDPFKERLFDAGVIVDSACFAQTIKVLRHRMCKNLAQVQEFETICLDAGYEGIMRRDPNGLYKQGRSTLKEGGLVAVKRFVDAEAVVLSVYEQQENTNEKTVNELGRSKRSSHKAGKVGKGVLGGFTVMPASMYLPLSERDKKLFMANVTSGLRHPEAFNIGTGVGLTDAVRAELWAKRKNLPGKIVKFRYQKIGTMAAPRLPIFLGFRDKGDM